MLLFPPFLCIFIFIYSLGWEESPSSDNRTHAQPSAYLDTLKIRSSQPASPRKHAFLVQAVLLWALSQMRVQVQRQLLLHQSALQYTLVSFPQPCFFWLRCISTHAAFILLQVDLEVLLQTRLHVRQAYTLSYTNTHTHTGLCVRLKLRHNKMPFW